jgi:hypothetical protein
MFIKNFAIHANPLVRLTKKDIEFQFREEEMKAMRTIKHLVTSSPAIESTIHANKKSYWLLTHHGVLLVLYFCKWDLMENTTLRNLVQ